MTKHALLSLFTAGLVLALPASADDWHDEGWYAGAGLGASRLVPDTGSTGFGVSDSRSRGGKIYVGYDLSAANAIEAHYADLGAAKISPRGTIAYSDMGAALVHYFWQQAPGREGWSVAGRLGLGQMSNRTTLDYDRVHDMHLSAGLGLERSLGEGYALRVDLDLYDKDAQLLTVGIMKRFGGAKPSPVVTPAAAPEPMPPVAAVATDPDSDGDGVTDSHDECPATVAGARVDQKGCPLETVTVLKGVTFATNSAVLAGGSAQVLDEVAASLARNPGPRVEIAGYTDNSGAPRKNQRLSQRRAEAVREYLISHGIAADRLVARGYGQEGPVADNRTADGRALNRRVELHLLP